MVKNSEILITKKKSFIKGSVLTLMWKTGSIIFIWIFVYSKVILCGSEVKVKIAGATEEPDLL